MPLRYPIKVLAVLVLGIAGQVSVPAEAADIHIAQLETKKDATSPGGAFVEDFDSDRLSSDWEVINPVADSFAVEDGALLMVSGTQGEFSKDTVTNLFKLTGEAPNGDWVATTRVKLDAQTGKESFTLLLHDDAQHHVGVGVYTWFECCGYNAVVEASAFKQQGEQTGGFHRRIWSSDVKSQIFGESARPMPAIVLRIEKRGHSFYPAVKLDGPPDADWIELERLVALRAKGRIGFALYQYDKVGGETVATVDWLRVEPIAR